MESTTSKSNSQRDFYLPGSAVPSPVPGRLERFVTNLLRDHSGLVWTAAADTGTREFSLPATPRP